MKENSSQKLHFIAMGGTARNLAKVPENVPEVAKNAIIEDIEDLQNDAIDLTKETNDLKE